MAEMTKDELVHRLRDGLIDRWPGEAVAISEADARAILDRLRTTPASQVERGALLVVLDAASEWAGELREHYEPAMARVVERAVHTILDALAAAKEEQDPEPTEGPGK